MFSVCVYCGAADVATSYFELAEATGKAIAEQGWRLVYGGGNTGLMGAVANGALAAGGEVVGIMPTFLVDQERAHRGISQLEVVENMAERKARFFDLSDAFVTLPGGMGTLDELFESITAYQLRLHEGISYILNANGFYSGLQQQMELMYQEGFIHQFRDALASGNVTPWVFEDSVEALIDSIQTQRQRAEKLAHAAEATQTTITPETV